MCFFVFQQTFYINLFYLHRFLLKQVLQHVHIYMIGLYYSQFSDGVGLPLHNIPSSGVLVKSIGAEFLRPNALPGVNHMHGMQYEIVLSILYISIVCISHLLSQLAGSYSTRPFFHNYTNFPLFRDIHSIQDTIHQSSCFSRSSTSSAFGYTAITPFSSAALFSLIFFIAKLISYRLNIYSPPPPPPPYHFQSYVFFFTPRIAFPFVQNNFPQNLSTSFSISCSSLTVLPLPFKILILSFFHSSFLINLFIWLNILFLLPSSFNFHITILLCSCSVLQINLFSSWSIYHQRTVVRLSVPESIFLHVRRRSTGFEQWYSI